MRWTGDSNRAVAAAPAVDSARLVLSIIVGDVLNTRPLPANGTVRIGRGSDADVSIDHPSIAPLHAALTMSTTLMIEDLGSPAGICVGGKRLVVGERRSVSIGEVIELGAIDVVVRRRDREASRVAPSDAQAEHSSDDIDAIVREPVVVRDPVMLQLRTMAERVAASKISVLLLGETGSGKEILAEVIHRSSPRHDKPFLRLNCAAFSETLLESEIFGHEKGSFSGATQSKAGLLESADGGTVFLDEIGEMSPSLQAKLLRVIQEQKVLRVGATRPRAIDVRFVSATNRDLRNEARRGTFRVDLFFRLDGISLLIPPLRQRPSEIEPLALFFLCTAAKEAKLVVPPRLSVAAVERLRGYDWPGNVRELRNVMERALVLCGGDREITVEHLPPELTEVVADPPAQPAAPPSRPPALGPGGVDGNEERRRTLEALRACGGNQTQAAKLLGISRTTMVNRLVRYALPRPRASVEVFNDPGSR